VHLVGFNIEIYYDARSYKRQIYWYSIRLFLFNITATIFVNFEVFAVVWLRIMVFWDVALCHWVTGCLCSEGKYCLHYQGLNGLRRIPLKHWEPPTQQHSITSQKTGILNLYFTHLRYFLITRCWSDWCSISGIRNCSGRTGLCRWVCCQTKCLWVSHPQSPGYTGYVYVNVTHIFVGTVSGGQYGC
jgi:hypothetical protein